MDEIHIIRMSWKLVLLFCLVCRCMRWLAFFADLGSRSSHPKPLESFLVTFSTSRFDTSTMPVLSEFLKGSNIWQPRFHVGILLGDRLGCGAHCHNIYPALPSIKLPQHHKIHFLASTNISISSRSSRHELHRRIESSSYFLPSICM